MHGKKEKEEQWQLTLRLRERKGRAVSDG